MAAERPRSENGCLIYPDGEGLYIPLDDAFWQRRFAGGYCRDTHGGISMPLWSFHTPASTITYLTLTDLQTELCFSQRAGRLSTYTVHSFRKRDAFAPYEIAIWPGGESPVSPGVEYRQWLVEHAQYVTLDRKIARNPQVARLLGAMHAYVFGDGATIQFLDELKRADVDKFWLGLQKPAQEGYIAKAKEFGYLAGPYDSFAKMQDRATSDSPSSVWDGLYKSGCIVDQRGAIKKGFQGRGCELSSEALELAAQGKQRDRETFGRWWPPERSGFFFKPVTVGEEFKKARYDPVYRLPLFQAAFHGSVVGRPLGDSLYEVS